jgi:hypothetical protein
MPQRGSDMPLLTELEKVPVGPYHYRHAAPDGAIRRGRRYGILRLGVWNRRQQRTQREAPCGHDGNKEGIAHVGLQGLRVRRETARACGVTESQRAGVQGAGGRADLERSREPMNREALATGPIPAGGQTQIGPVCRGAYHPAAWREPPGFPCAGALVPACPRRFWHRRSG